MRAVLHPQGAFGARRCVRADSACPAVRIADSEVCGVKKDPARLMGGVDGWDFGLGNVLNELAARLGEI